MKSLSIVKTAILPKSACKFQIKILDFDELILKLMGRKKAKIKKHFKK